jgi:hypothetical protein
MLVKPAADDDDEEAEAEAAEPVARSMGDAKFTPQIG